MNNKEFLEDLQLRGILKDISDQDKFLNLEKGKKIYIGFDPTASSLHLGNYIAINLLQRLKQFDIPVIAVVGGATGMIGDPSFASKERVLLSNQTLLENKAKIIAQLQKFNLDVFDNLEIYKDMNIIEFLRDIGKNINIAYLLAKDSIATRIQSGLSFTEFSYQLIQGWDFKYLYENFNVVAQAGGSDQWGNMVTGLDLIKKTVANHKQDAFVMTVNLLTDENGVKFGKTFGGSPIWLDANMYSPYNLYQFLFNQSDAQAEKIIKWLSFQPLSKINELIVTHNENKKARILQKELAHEIVANIHGKSGLKSALEISDILFGKTSYQEISYENKQELKKVLPLLSSANFSAASLIEQKVFNSKRELNEFIAQGALEINGQKIAHIEMISANLKDENNLFLIKKGKKNFFIFEQK
ncbi:tyrosine--tRNA ligase [Mesomycoplasma conjunctivae]|uniref:tyrosine--tRNA ligase n=1 Tax=Mesomycoplasma conjunctivae TaxID=45361 RepID=UPI003DA5A357